MVARLIVLGCVCVGAGVHTFINAGRDLRGFPLNGVVVANEEKTRRDRYGFKQRTYYPIVEYTSPTTGTRQRTTSRVSYPKPLEIGASVDMTYNHERKEARFPIRSNSTAAIYMLVGAALVLLSLTLL